jgi:PKD repeat protein
MKKGLFVLIIAVLFVALAFGQIGSVSACGEICGCPNGGGNEDCGVIPTTTPKIPECDFDVSITSGEAPLMVNIVNGGDINGTTTWDFGDESVGFGENMSHRYTMVGTFTLEKTFKSENGQRCWQAETIKVYPSTSIVETPVVVVATEVPDVSGNNTYTASTSGDNSPAVIGDNNEINITISVPPTVVTPVPQETETKVDEKVDNNQDQNQNLNNNNVTVQPGDPQITTQKVSKLGAFFHAVLKAWEAFVHNLDEGLFPTTLVK